jgi:hypothetical protein
MADDVTTAIDPGTEDPTVDPAAEPPTGSPETLPREAEPPAADPAEVKAETPANWRDTIEDEKARKLADRFTTAADMAKATLEFQQKLSKAIVLPGKDAEPEEVAAFHKALGVPATPDAYKVTVDEEVLGKAEDSELLKEFLAISHKNHVSTAAAQDYLDWQAGVVKATMKAEAAALKKAADEGEATLRKEMGDDYDANAQLAHQTAREYGGEDLMAFADNVKIDGMLLGDHPVFVRTFTNVGRMVGEARPLIGMTDDQVSSLQEEQSDLLAKQAMAIDDGNTVEADRLDRRLQEIARKQVGEQPIVGAQGRAV